jgi:transcriptional regulator with XRE-family HTH domain
MTIDKFEQEFGKYKNEELIKKDLNYQVGKMLIEARLFRHFTQAQLARKIKSHQPAIARIENGTTLPSLKTLNKIAKALETYLLPPQFGFQSDIYIHTQASKISSLSSSNYTNYKDHFAKFDSMSLDVKKRVKSNSTVFSFNF